MINLHSILDLDGIKRVYVGDSLNISSFYICDLFAFALSKLKASDCLISNIQSKNGLLACHLKGANTYIICETDKADIRIKRQAKQYNITVLLYKYTSYELLSKINEMERKK